MTDCTPRYVADFEKGDIVLVYDRWAQMMLPPMKFANWRTMTWCPEGSSFGIEAAHGARYSQWSRSQKWSSPEDLRAFHAACAARHIDLRFLPEKAVYTHRLCAGLTKSGENDLRAWDYAFTQRPSLWTTCQRPENLGDFLDPAVDPRDYATPTKQQAVFAYREDLKDASRLLSASEEKNKYKRSAAGRLAYHPECIRLVAERLEQHSSSDAHHTGITAGVATYTFANGTTVSLSLLDVLGLSRDKRGRKWRQPERDTQYVSCMMLLVNSEGQRYRNPLTAQPWSFRDIKQHGMVSNAFHGKPGFLRPKFYHHGIKQIVKPYATEQFGTKMMTYEGETRAVPAIDWTVPEHAAFVRWIRNTCRIAYEQTTKAMMVYLNRYGVPTSEQTLFEEEDTEMSHELVLV